MGLVGAPLGQAVVVSRQVTQKPCRSAPPADSAEVRLDGAAFDRRKEVDQVDPDYDGL